MNKQQIKIMTTKQMLSLKFKWLLVIASKPQQFGKASIRAIDALHQLGHKRVQFNWIATI